MIVKDDRERREETGEGKEQKIPIIMMTGFAMRYGGMNHVVLCYVFKLPTLKTSEPLG